MTPDKQTETRSEIWIVVCGDMHAALGPFVSEHAATGQAVRMTNDTGDGCVYFPVAMALTDGFTISYHPGMTQEHDHDDKGQTHPGQYL